MINSEADDIENVQHQFRNNTKDTHRADKENTKQKGEHVTKKKNNLFHNKVEGVHMDLLQCGSSMTSFNFKVVDKMGCVERNATT